MIAIIAMTLHQAGVNSKKEWVKNKLMGCWKFQGERGIAKELLEYAIKDSK